MKLSLEQIKKISCVLVNIEEKNGYFRLTRFTNEQLKLYKEYKGGYYEIREVEFEQENGSKETREITIEYNIWYKLAD